MRTAAENQKEILASTPNSLCWWIGHQTYWGVFAWTPGTYTDTESPATFVLRFFIIIY